MIQCPVLFVIGAAALNVQLLRNRKRRAALLCIHIEGFENVAFFLCELLPCRFEPVHVFHCLPVPLLDGVDLFDPLDDSLFPCLRIVGMRHAVKIGRTDALHLHSYRRDLFIGVFHDEIHTVIGGNGLGKSTFLKTLAGKLPLKSGKFKFGHGVEPGYFDQQMAQYVSDKNVLNDFWDIYPYLTETEVRNILGGFLFTGDDVFKEVSLLSGGEKVRLALAKIFETRPNLLLLDEPTNHMDIVGKEALEQMLKDYEGTLIFVTHDRYLVREVADALIVFSGDGIKWFPWNYEEYERSFGKEKQDAAKDIWNIDRNTSEKKTEAAKENGEQQKPAINIGKEKSRMERRIAKIESLLAENDTVREELTLKLADPSISSDYVKLGEIQKAIDDLDKNDEDLMSEWERLSGELENLS